MKTPISYYGGKQRLVKTILPLIPTTHISYVEPFFGGGAVYFAKEPSRIEVINDSDNFVVNFYKVVKKDYQKLKKLLDSTLHSRGQYQEARQVYNNPENYDDVQRAWAFWVLSQMSYSYLTNTVWWYSKTNTTNIPSIIKNKIDNFVIDYCDRLRQTQIKCDDALKVIDCYDSKDTFFYADPPYYNSNCGKYQGYTIDDYENLLKVLSNIKGQFILSSYPSDILNDYKIKNNWSELQIEKTIAVLGFLKEKRYKTETLIANYDFKQMSSYQNFFTR
jgi:DNA adenine methylase